MKPYFDVGFLACLFYKAPATTLAVELCHRFAPPWEINTLQRLQLENGMLRQLDNPKHAQAAAKALVAWRHYLDEGMFSVSGADWDTAFHLAHVWNNQSTGKPEAHGFLVHVGLAVASGATHLLSFDPRPRQLAKSAGLKLLPERL